MLEQGLLSAVSLDISIHSHLKREEHDEYIRDRLSPGPALPRQHMGSLTNCRPLTVVFWRRYLSRLGHVCLRATCTFLVVTVWRSVLKLLYDAPRAQTYTFVF